MKVDFADASRLLPGDLGRGHYAVGMAGVLALAAACALLGTGAGLPLTGHDVFVARTAEHMLSTGDYIIPVMNGEHRLTKPPLGYWAVALVDRLGDRDGRISPFESRLPSALAAIGIVVLATMLGVRLFRRPIGLLSGLLVVSSSGFSAYSHSARPEMLYAFLTGAGALGLATAFRPRSGATVMAGWALLGLAGLCKGPQFPVIAILFLVTLLARRESIRIAVQRTWFIPGFILFLGTWVWWYVVVRQEAPTADDIVTGQVAKHWLPWQESFTTFISPYYLFRTAGLTLPWVLLYLLAAFTPIAARSERRRHALVLWWAAFVAMLLFSFAGRRRWYYMLPLLIPLAPLMADQGLQVMRLYCVHRRKTYVGVLIVLCVAAPAILISLQMMNDPINRPGIPWLVTSSLVTSVAVLLLFRWDARRVLLHGFAVALVWGVFFLAGHESGATFRSDRFLRWRFAEEASALVVPSDPVLSLTSGFEIEQYALGRDIPIGDGNWPSDATPRWIFIDREETKGPLPPSARVVIESAERAERGEGPRYLLVRWTGP